MLAGLLKSNVSYGLELNIRENDQICIRLTGLKNVKGHLEMIMTEKEVDSIEELKGLIKIYQNITISITGRGLLIKPIQIKGEKSNANLLKQVIPGAAVEDYYLQACYISTTIAIVTIIKRNPVDELLNMLYEAGYYINHVILGPFAATSLYPLIKQFNTQLENEWQLEGYQLEFENAKLKTVIKRLRNETGCDDMFTGSEPIKSLYIISYSSASFYFLNANSLFEDNYTGIQVSRHNLKLNILQTGAIRVLMILIIVLTVLNAVFFTYQYSINIELKEKSLCESVKYKNYESLKREFDLKRALAADLGMFSEYNMGFILDRLALSRPGEIKWTKLEYNPLDIELFKSKRIRAFHNNRILLEGECNNPIALNNWISNLEEQAWVQDVKNQSFKFDENRKTGVLKFEIQLK